LKDIDDTDLELLVDFIFYQNNDPNVRTIGGKQYKRAQGVPNWL